MLARCDARALLDRCVFDVCLVEYVVGACSTNDALLVMLRRSVNVCPNHGSVVDACVDARATRSSVLGYLGACSAHGCAFDVG